MFVLSGNVPPRHDPSLMFATAVDMVQNHFEFLMSAQLGGPRDIFHMLGDAYTLEIANNPITLSGMYWDHIVGSPFNHCSTWTARLRYVYLQTLRGSPLRRQCPLLSYAVCRYVRSMAACIPSGRARRVRRAQRTKASMSPSTPTCRTPLRTNATQRQRRANDEGTVRTWVPHTRARCVLTRCLINVVCSASTWKWNMGHRISALPGNKCASPALCGPALVPCV